MVAAAGDNPAQVGTWHADGVVDAVHRKRRVGIQLRVAELPGRATGFHQLLVVIELGNQAVELRFDLFGH